MVCQKCGNELKPGAKFCANCGDKVVFATASKSPQAPVKKPVKVAVKANSQGGAKTPSVNTSVKPATPVNRATAQTVPANKNATSVGKAKTLGEMATSFKKSVTDDVKMAAQKIEAVGLESPAATDTSTSSPTPNTINVSINEHVDSKYIPISMWGYFGYEILFSIPVIGLIFLLIYSFGSTTNLNLKNFARSYFCLLIIAFVIALITSAIAGGSMLFFL